MSGDSLYLSAGFQDVVHGVRDTTTREGGEVDVRAVPRTDWTRADVRCISARTWVAESAI